MHLAGTMSCYILLLRCTRFRPRTIVHQVYAAVNIPCNPALSLACDHATKSFKYCCAIVLASHPLPPIGQWTFHTVLHVFKHFS